METAPDARADLRVEVQGEGPVDEAAGAALGTDVSVTSGTVVVSAPDTGRTQVEAGQTIKQTGKSKAANKKPKKTPSSNAKGKA